MKKTILLLCIVIVTVACKIGTKSSSTDSTLSKSETKDVKPKDSLTPTTVYETLNGVDEAKALDMIRYFQDPKNVDNNPVMQYFLLKKDMLVKIAKLLDDELAAETNAPHKTDGIRIYFAKESADPKKVKLLIVSTIDSSDAICTHHDYYGHLSAESLFDGTDLTLQAVDKSPIHTGAVLYDNCSGTGCDDDPTCANQTYPHKTIRKIAEQMVQACGGRALNTEAEWFDKNVIDLWSRDPKCDALRIYFATHLGNDANVNYRNRDAFIITTTQRDAKDTSIYLDYFDCPKVEQYLSIYRKSKRARTPLYPPFDNGSLCPNNCD